MKIVHINTFTTGGAAAAALKLHSDLLGSGIESKLLSLEGPIDPLKKPEVYRASLVSSNLNRQLRYFYAKCYYKLFSTLAHSAKDHEIFSLPYSRFDVSSEPLVKKADIIHLHWVAGFVDYPSFFRKINKPMVWTLHDMNPFLGAFHYKNDEILNKSTALRKKDTDIKALKRNVFREVQNITIVSPSKWLMDTSKESGIFSHLQHHWIPYSVNTDTYLSTDKQLAREKLNLPADAIILTFVSDNVNNRRKGFEVFKQAIIPIIASYNTDRVVILNIGSGSCDINHTLNMGRINDQAKMAQLLSASDAVVLPSLEDNFPNVMLEANACGCPVVGFPIGGIKEFIIDGFNGVLATDVSSQALQHAILSFIRHRDKFHPSAIRAHIVKKYSPNQQFNAYLQIYNQLLGLRQGATALPPLI